MSPASTAGKIRAYADANGNGVLDAGETFVSQTTATVLGVDGVYSFTLNPGKYVVCEVLQTGWHQSRPSGNTICSADSSLGAAGFPVTIISGASHPDNDFGNNKLFRLIILTCSETTQTLVQSLVDTDGDFTTLGDQKTTIGPAAPPLGGRIGRHPAAVSVQPWWCPVRQPAGRRLHEDHSDPQALNPMSGGRCCRT